MDYHLIARCTMILQVVAPMLSHVMWTLLIALLVWISEDAIRAYTTPNNPVS